MFKSLISASLVAFLACNVALANPLAREGDGDRRNGDDGPCMSQEQVDKILSTWINFFVSPVAADLAAKILTPDFHYFSESLNSVTPGKGDTAAKVSAPIATDIPSFIASQSFNGGTSRFAVKAKVFSCDTITFRWQISSLTSFPVSGLDLLLLTKDRGRFKIKTAYSEFNTVALLVALGVFPSP